MHAAQRSLSMVERDVALRQIGIEAVSFKFPPAPRARKKTALVVLDLDVNFEDLG